MDGITHQHVIELVKTLPADRLGSLYDFALFLKARSPLPADFEDIFGESEEAIRADEERWDELFARTGDGLLRLAEQALEEYRA